MCPRIVKEVRRANTDRVTARAAGVPGAVRSAVAVALVAAPAAFVAGACSALIDGELEVVRCTQHGAYGPPACPEGQSCVSGLCVEAGAPLGQPCTADAVCSPPAFCLTARTPQGSEVSRCARPCCASTDCGSPAGGLVCWPEPTGGGNVCWPAAAIGRAELGAGRAGASCSGGADCRSGQCALGVCADTCCDDSHCQDEPQTPGGQCAIGALAPGEPLTWTCGEVRDGAAGGFPCLTDVDCASGRCLLVGTTDGGVEVRVCAAWCCSTVECGAVQAGGEVHGLACAPITGTALRACSRLRPPGARGSVGAPCTSGAQCRSGICLEVGLEGDGAGFCSDLCCSDDSCGDVSRFVCRPLAEGLSWSLQCTRK